MIATLGFTFTNINLEQAEPLQFVGLRNYEKLLNDPTAIHSLSVTFRYALLALPVAVLFRSWSHCCSTRGTCEAVARSASSSSCPTSCRSWRAS